LAGDPARLRTMQENAGKTTEEQEPGEERREIDPAQLRQILDPGWDRLDLAERAAILCGLVEQVAYDGANSKVTITFRREGIEALANQENHA
jgi:hypothetical protein